MITLKKVATIICEWEDGNRGCTNTATFKQVINYKDDDEFVGAAFLYFINLGWDIITTTHLCPYCAAGRPSDD